jgi:hypothetical protein
MNPLEEFNNYYLQQLNEYSEDLKYSEIVEKKEERKANVEIEDIKNSKIKDLNSATSKRLRTLPKRYQIYTVEYKKKILEEVNK